MDPLDVEPIEVNGWYADVCGCICFWAAQHKHTHTQTHFHSAANNDDPDG